MQKLLDNIPIVVLTCLIVILSSFILVGVTYHKTQQVNSYNSSKVSEMNEVLGMESLPQNIKIGVFGEVVSIPTIEIIKSYDSEKNIVLNDQKLVEKLPLKISSLSGAYLNSDTVSGCDTKTFNITLNLNSLSQKLTQKFTESVYIDFYELIQNEESKTIYYACDNYFKGIKPISNFLSTLQIQDSELDNLFILKKNKLNQYNWQIRDENRLRTFLTSYQNATKQDPSNGEFIYKNNSIYLITPYKVGKALDIDKTIQNIDIWKLDTAKEIKIEFSEVQPPVLKQGMPIVDMTKILGTGKSRIDIIRNGRFNYSLWFAQMGLEELNNVIIEPGQEFSYLKELNPKNGVTEDGRSIGSGICNSTTTLFRATLESGFQVTERHEHSHNVASYEWGYPINVVDAAYFTNPPLDFKFINDLNYPILLKFIVTRPGDGFQYHTLEVHTSQEAPTREVELKNWKKWGEGSGYRFQGSFDRVVKQNGEVIREDSFKSVYWKARPVPRR